MIHMTYATDKLQQKTASFHCHISTLFHINQKGCSFFLCMFTAPVCCDQTLQSPTFFFSFHKVIKKTRISCERIVVLL